MDEPADPPSPAARRRRRRQAAHEEPPPQRQPKKSRAYDATERGLRDLVGAGNSRVGVSGALRARDLNRPTAADLAAAEEEVVIVRRHWQPPAT